MSKKTLVILTPAFPADESDAESIWVPAKQRLIKCFNRLYPELEVVILSFRFPEGKEKYYWNNNLVLSFGGGNKSRIKNWLVWIRAFRELKRLKRQKEIIGLLSFWCTECALVAHYFYKIYGTKHLCWISGQDAKPDNKFVQRIRPDKEELVAMSDFLVNEFDKNHHIRPAYLIPDAIDPYQFNPGILLERTIDVIGVGGLSPLKQYDMFIEIIAALKTKYPNIRAYLCGHGLEREKLEGHVRKLSLENNITFTGKISQQAVFTLMQRSKILLHPSAYEGFGNVCIEALYAGAHVISFIQPMKQEIPQWHIVHTKKEMIEKVKEILLDRKIPHTSVLPFNMNDSAKQFMQIFLENDRRLNQ